MTQYIKGVCHDHCTKNQEILNGKRHFLCSGYTVTVSKLAHSFVSFVSILNRIVSSKISDQSSEIGKTLENRVAIFCSIDS